MTQQQVAVGTAVELRDGRSVLIRPLAEDDRTALLVFGKALPTDEWLYLENDLQNPEIVRRLANAAAAENWRQLVAVNNGDLVGYAAIRRLTGWSKHVADIHLIVSCGWRRNGLGSALARIAFSAARELGVSKIISEMFIEQEAGQAIFRRLGFQHEGTMVAHACDHHGNPHDLVVMAYHVS